MGFGRVDENDQFLFTSRTTGVLIQHKDTTGTRKDLMGVLGRQASNTIFSFRLPDVVDVDSLRAILKTPDSHNDP